MMRAWKTLLIAVTADVACLSSAARQNLKVETASSVINVMDKITGLLEAHGGNEEVLLNLKLLASQRVTPGAKDSLNEILLKVLNDIDENVQSKIKSGHTDTQSAINQRIADLRSATTQAVDRKGDADAADNTWYNCVRAERGAKVAIEEAEKELAQSRSDTNEPCQVKEDRSPYSWKSNPNSLKFYCDIAQYGNCDEQIQNYRYQIQNMAAGLRSDVAYKKQSFNEAKKRCDAAKAVVIEKQDAHSSSIAAWHSKKRECLQKHEPRQVAMCVFGATLQAKCEKVEAYKTLMSQIDQVKGGEYSHPDRVAEWRTTALTKCLLSKVVDGSDVDGYTLEACEKSVNFAEQVGELDRHSAAFAKLTSDAMFSCTEKTIKFKGEAWDVPRSESPDSSEYVVKPFEPEVPFSFCEGGDSGGKGADPCIDPTSCECFESRDPNFCNTCPNCGTCQDYCAGATPAPAPELPCAPPFVSCACWGDPHCKRSFFEDKKFNFQGRGLFRYAASVDSSFEAQTFQCQWGNRRASVISAMAVKANGHILTMVDLGVSAVDGVPHSDGDALPNGMQIKNNGAKVLWDDELFHFYTHRKLGKKFGQIAHRFDIRLLGANASSEGVCGNPDAGRQNIPDSDSLFSTAELNQLYTRCGLTPDQRTDADAPEETPQEACDAAGIALADAEQACESLKDQDDFYEGCIFDFCVGEGDNELVEEAEGEKQILKEREQLFSSRPCGTCDEDPQSCACFAERDPNFCDTCPDCGKCQDFCDAE